MSHNDDQMDNEGRRPVRAVHGPHRVGYSGAARECRSGVAGTSSAPPAPIRPTSANPCRTFRPSSGARASSSVRHPVIWVEAPSASDLT